MNDPQRSTSDASRLPESAALAPDVFVLSPVTIDGVSIAAGVLCLVTPGGETVRVPVDRERIGAVARALMTHPAVLLLAREGVTLPQALPTPEKSYTQRVMDAAFGPVPGNPLPVDTALAALRAEHDALVGQYGRAVLRLAEIDTAAPRGGVAADVVDGWATALLDLAYQPDARDRAVSLAETLRVAAAEARKAPARTYADGLREALAACERVRAERQGGELNTAGAAACAHDIHALLIGEKPPARTYADGVNDALDAIAKVTRTLVRSTDRMALDAGAQAVKELLGDPPKSPTVPAMPTVATMASDRAPMTLGMLTAWLEAAVAQHGADFRWTGVADPHSYRGYYDQLGFETKGTTLGESLAQARGANRTTYTGWKGGDFVMALDTPVWHASWGSCGEPITALSLAAMLPPAVPFDPARHTGRSKVVAMLDNLARSLDQQAKHYSDGHGVASAYQSAARDARELASYFRTPESDAAPIPFDPALHVTRAEVVADLRHQSTLADMQAVSLDNNDHIVGAQAMRETYNRLTDLAAKYEVRA